MQRLAVGVGMRGVHQPVLNAKLLVQHLRRWRQTISGATPVADHKMLGRIVQRVVHAHHHRQIVIFSRGGNNDAFCAAARDMYRRFFTFGEEAGGFDYHLNASVFPRNVCRVTFTEYGDALPVNL